MACCARGSLSFSLGLHPEYCLKAGARVVEELAAT